MLVLTRRFQESIMIGDDIRVVVLGLDGLNVRLGIQAPRAVTVHRLEVYHRILEQDKQTGQGVLLQEGPVRQPGQWCDNTSNKNRFIQL